MMPGRSLSMPGCGLPVLLAMAGFAACGASPPELQPVEHVELPRFMGRWYVIANIPTFLEENAYNAVETYSLDGDGTIATTFTYRKGSFDGKVKAYHPRGFVRGDASNAVWGMQFIWPIKADYRIVYLAPDYSTTVVARNERDYVWLMARTPHIPDDEYRRLAAFIGKIGYDTGKLEKVPQQW